MAIARFKNIKISETTKRDWETVKTAGREFMRDIRSPLFWIAVIFTAAMIAAPFLFEPVDLPW